MEKNAQQMEALEFTKAKEFEELKTYLVSSSKTLYELENELVSKIESGSMWVDEYLNILRKK